MNVSYEEASRSYHSLPPERRVPSLHPYYIQADSLRDPTLQPVYFLYRENGEIFYHGFLLGHVEGTAFSDIQSPYGFGGPISSTDDPLFIQRAWEQYMEWCVKQNVMVEFIRFHPLLHNWKYYYGESFVDRETVWIDLQVGNLMDSYKTRVRTAVRKAQKCGQYTEISKDSDEVAAFIRIYRDTMKSLNADGFYFFSDSYVNRLLDWEQSFLINCKFEDEIVAAAILLTDGSTMEYHLSASNARGKEMGATNLILHEAGLLGQKLGLKQLHLGGGTNKDERNPLFFFKSGFSANRSVYKIGKCVHMADSYQDLRSSWDGKNLKTNRVLFYR